MPLCFDILQLWGCFKKSYPRTLLLILLRSSLFLKVGFRSIFWVLKKKSRVKNLIIG